MSGRGPWLTILQIIYPQKNDSKRNVWVEILLGQISNPNLQALGDTDITHPHEIQQVLCPVWTFRSPGTGVFLVLR